MLLNGSVTDLSAALPRVGWPTPTSKISIPARESWVIPRHRLFDRLTRASRGTVTVVTGPPGAGKTSAVAGWAASGRAPGPVAWLSCDEVDDEPTLFWREVIEALKCAGVTVSVDATGERGRVIMSELASDLGKHPIPVVLVLDDFRQKPGSAVIDGMSYLVKHARPGLRLVIVARVDPPLALNRYRLTNELTEIGASDLALSERETVQLLAQHQVVLKPASVRVLRERTEGWAAGVRLAAMSLEGLDDPDPAIARFSGDDRAVAAYMLEEALDCQSSELRRLMLTVSVAERFNSELALELTDGMDQDAFSVMVRSNAFVIPLGQGWYRYHGMFGEALRLMLRHENPGEVPILYRRAAAWFNREGFQVETVRHAVLANDWRYATRLVVDLLAIGQVMGLIAGSPLVGVFSGMPESLILNGNEPEPALVAAADAAARGDAASCTVALQRADAILDHLPEDRSSAARLTADVIRLLDLTSNDLVAAPDPRVTSDRVLDGLSARPFGRHPDLYALVHATRGRAALWDGDLTEAAAAFAAAVSSATEAGGDNLDRYCVGHLALVEALLGRLRRADDLAAEAGPRSEPRTGRGGLPLSALHAARARLHLERCDVQSAGRELAQSRELAEASPDACISALNGLISARLQLLKGSPDAALATLAATRAATKPLPWLDRMVTLVEAEAHAASGDAIAAVDAAERAGGLSSPDSTVALARAQARRGNLATAMNTLQSLSESPDVPTDVRIEAMLLDAHLSYTIGDTSRTPRAIDRALRLAQRERICLPFALSKAWLRPLLRRYPELVRQHHQTLELLHITGLAPSDAVHGRDHGEPSAYGHLSSREIDVLRRVAKLMTSEEIAQEMFLSVNTVKTHLRNIYRKLAVTRRFEAVRRAQQLQLL